MTKPVKEVLQSNFAFLSSIKKDVWHPKKTSEAYEWWYFDALSDDGSEAIVIVFLDNPVFSPRYNSQNRKPTTNETSEIKHFPAVAFTYYKDGKPVYRTINEFSDQDFNADLETPECKIGKNSFRFEKAPYGTGYVISINAILGKNKRLKARFEWLSIESDFLQENKLFNSNAHYWNLVAPRSDVTGKITVTNSKGRSSDEINFRGTGYHDHNFDTRWMPETVKDWQWGRVHFPDVTAVFYRYNEVFEKNETTKLFLIKHGELNEFDATCETQKIKRNFLGLKYPLHIKFTAKNNIRLRIKQKEIIDSSFFYLRFLSEITLSLNDGKPRRTLGITEHLAPKSLKYRWLDWLINLRIDRKKM